VGSGDISSPNGNGSGWFFFFFPEIANFRREFLVDRQESDGMVVLRLIVATQLDSVCKYQKVRFHNVRF
jgi:hypothetical protein